MLVCFHQTASKFAMDNAHQPSRVRKLLFTSADEDYAFKASPCGQGFSDCSLCVKTLKITEKGVDFCLKSHAKSSKHMKLVKSLLDRNPGLVFKYEEWLDIESQTPNDHHSHDSSVEVPPGDVSLPEINQNDTTFTQTNDQQLNTDEQQPISDKRDITAAMEGN